jgi:molybdate transport system substrate-binding protein
MKLSFRLLLGVLAMAAFMSSAVRAIEVNVFAAASLTDALKELAPIYEKQTGDKLVFNLGASSQLARQIEAGAPADVFLSADEAKVDGLDKKGLLEPGSRHDLLGNTLVIVVYGDSKIDIHSPQDLASPGLTHLALAQPESVPAGIYAKQYLTKLGLWDKVSSKVVPLDNVRAALAAVESGNADAGFVYKTDALISKKVKVAYEVAASEGPKIVYPIVVLKDSKNLDAAKKAALFLESKEALEIFKKYGFLPPQ